MKSWHSPWIPLLSWGGLLALLTLTVFGAYQPLGSFKTVPAIAVASANAYWVE